MIRHILAALLLVSICNAQTVRVIDIISPEGNANGHLPCGEDITIDIIWEYRVPIGYGGTDTVTHGGNLVVSGVTFPLRYQRGHLLLARYETRTEWISIWRTRYKFNVPCHLLNPIGVGIIKLGVGMAHSPEPGSHTVKEVLFDIS